MLFWNIGFVLAYKLISPLHPASHFWIKQLFSSDQNNTFSASLSFQVHATVSQDSVFVALGGFKGVLDFILLLVFQTTADFKWPLCDWALWLGSLQLSRTRIHSYNPIIFLFILNSLLSDLPWNAIMQNPHTVYVALVIYYSRAKCT